jgi:hypothetical protein
MPIKPIYHPDTVPFSDGGHRCDRCETVLGLQDLRGFYSGTMFHIRGYLCPACGCHTCDTTIKGGNVQFDWRRMPVSRVPIRNVLGGAE